MTQSNDKPTGKGPEATPSDPKSVDNQLDAFLILGGHPNTTTSAAPDKTGGADHPHTPVKAADHRTGYEAFSSGAKNSLGGFGDTTAAAFGATAKTDDQLAEARAHNAGNDGGGSTILALAKTGLAMVTHPKEIATGLGNLATSTYQTMAHGTSQEKWELAGGASVTALSFLLPTAASKLSKLTAEGSAVNLAERGLVSTDAARAGMGVYKETAAVSREAALANAEARTAAVTEKALVVAKPVTGMEAALAVKPVAGIDAALAVKPVAGIDAALLSSQLPVLTPPLPPSQLPALTPLLPPSPPPVLKQLQEYKKQWKLVQNSTFP